MKQVYYIIYLTDGSIHLKPFGSRKSAKAYQEEFDAKVKAKGRFKFSKVTKKTIDSELWL